MKKPWKVGFDWLMSLTVCADKLKVSQSMSDPNFNENKSNDLSVELLLKRRKRLAEAQCKFNSC